MKYRTKIGKAGLTVHELEELKTDFGIDMENEEILAGISETEFAIISELRSRKQNKSIRGKAREAAGTMADMMEALGESIFAEGYLRGLEERK